MEQAHDVRHDDASSDDIPGQVTHAEMNTALDTGAAVPLAASIGWLARYHGSWWVVYEHGWLCITDAFTAADIEATAARLAHRASDRTEEPCPPPH